MVPVLQGRPAEPLTAAIGATETLGQVALRVLGHHGGHLGTVPLRVVAPVERRDAVDRAECLIPAPVVVMVKRPCLTPLALISASAIFFTAAAVPLTTSTSRQLS